MAAGVGGFYTMLIGSSCAYIVLVTSVLAPGDAAGTGSTHSRHGAVAAVTVCRRGFGYPPFCPLAGGPRNATRCCRKLLEPACCHQRASLVCMRPGGTRKLAAFNADPKPGVSAIFCPGPGDPSYYDMCCWRKYSSFCCSRYLTPQIFGGVFGGLGLAILVGLLFFYILRCRKSGKASKSLVA